MDGEEILERIKDELNAFGKNRVNDIYVEGEEVIVEFKDGIVNFSASVREFEQAVRRVIVLFKVMAE